MSSQARSSQCCDYSIYVNRTYSVISAVAHKNQSAYSIHGDILRKIKTSQCPNTIRKGSGPTSSQRRHIPVARRLRTQSSDSAGRHRVARNIQRRAASTVRANGADEHSAAAAEIAGRRRARCGRRRWRGCRRDSLASAECQQRKVHIKSHGTRKGSERKCPGPEVQRRSERGVRGDASGYKCKCKERKQSAPARQQHTDAREQSAATPEAKRRDVTRERHGERARRGWGR